MFGCLLNVWKIVFNACWRCKYLDSDNTSQFSRVGHNCALPIKIAPAATGHGETILQKVLLEINIWKWRSFWPTLEYFQQMKNIAKIIHTIVHVTTRLIQHTEKEKDITTSYQYTMQQNFTESYDTAHIIQLLNIRYLRSIAQWWLMMPNLPEKLWALRKVTPNYQAPKILLFQFSCILQNWDKHGSTIGKTNSLNFTVSQSKL